VDTKTIFFDESGNTEAGISDPKQLFVTYASVLSSEKICKTALCDAFPDTFPNEIKYTNVNDDKDKIIEALSFVKKNGGKFKIYQVYKPLFLFHSLLTSFFEDEAEYIGADHLSGEPDFTYTRMHTFWFYYMCARGSKFLAQLVYAYQLFVRKPRKKYYKNLYDLTKLAADDGCSVTTFIFNSINRLGFDGAKELISKESKFNTSYIDTALPCTLQTISRWSHELNEPFYVIHDKSYPVEKRTKLFNHLNSLAEKPKKKIKSKVDQTLTWVLPQVNLKEDIKFEDSRIHYGLQVADILAGAFNNCARSIEDETSHDIREFFEKLALIVDDKDFMFMSPDITYANPWEREYIRLKEMKELCSSQFKDEIKNQKIRDRKNGGKSKE